MDTSTSMLSRPLRPSILYSAMRSTTRLSLDPNFCTTDFGNLGRNTFRGPHQQNWDFSLIRDLKLTEKQSLRFTTDLFNIWNHANLGNPSINDVRAFHTIRSLGSRLHRTVWQNHQHRGHASANPVLAALRVSN